jgi:hypothetical protein
MMDQESIRRTEHTNRSRSVGRKLGTVVRLTRTSRVSGAFLSTSKSLGQSFGASSLTLLRSLYSYKLRESFQCDEKSRVSGRNIDRLGSDLLIWPSLPLPTPSNSLYTDRIAQQSFRKRQKAYYIDLQKEVIEKTDKIQAITKSNQFLLERMDGLQTEIVAVSQVFASSARELPLSPF